MGKRQKIISFDFDDTLCFEDGTPNYAMIDMVHKHAAEGFKCYIVTSRNKAHETPSWIAKNRPGRIRVKDFIKDYELPIKQCHFTNHEPKHLLLSLYRNNGIVHYDDDEMVLNDLRRAGIECIKSFSNLEQ